MALAAPTSTSLPLAEEVTTTLPYALPPITAGTSAEYMRRLEEISSRAFAAEPLTIAFASERLGITEVTPADIACAHATRLATKVAAGAEIVEAGNWAAAACWEPPGVCAASLTTSADSAALKSRPVFADFHNQITAAKRKHLGETSYYWHLSMMARDPSRTTRGAVRAVLEPYLARARRDRVPIWIEAGSARARDVYAYFGFRIVEEIWSGVGKIGASGHRQEGGPGVPTWLMIYTTTTGV